jgi:hypothetical protein
MTFKITKLESRLAPAATGLIPSVNLGDPGVNGAEHACKGLSHNHTGDWVWERHGCGKVEDCPPKPCGCK